MKKTTKRMMISAVALLTTAGLVGCTANNEAKKDSNPVTVEIFNSKVETKDQLKEIAKLYEEEHKDVKINIETVGGGQDSDSALLAKYKSGNAPSIFMGNGMTFTKKWQSKLVDISDSPLIEKALPGTTDGATLDGKVYGYPIMIEGYGLLVNKELFEKAGVKTTDIKSFDDFKKSVETVDKKKEELGIDAVFGFSAKELWVIEQYSNAFLAPEYDNDMKNSYTAETIDFQYKDIFKKYTDLIKKYNIQPILSLDYSTSIEELFTNKKVAVVHQGNWIIPSIDAIDPDFVKENLDIVPFFIEDDGVGRINAGASMFWVVNNEADQEVIEASQDFIEWMYTDEQAKKSIVEDFKYIPTYSNFGDVQFEDALTKAVYQYSVDGNAYSFVNTTVPQGWLMQEFAPEFQKYLTDEISWDDLLDEAKEKWEVMREEENN